MQRSNIPTPRVIDLAERAGPRGRTGGPVRVLLLEDDPLFSSLVRSALVESRAHFEIESVSRLTTALALLVRDHFDLILADLNLPDSRGAATVRFLKRAAPNVPLIALSGADNLDLALEAVREGAEEYVAKGTFSVHSLVWLVLLVLERHRRVVEDLGKGYVDPVSGLSSLPALEVLGRYLLRMADRTGLHLGLLFVRVQPAARGQWSDWEALLVAVAGVLRQTLRRCDVLSRMGHTELAVVLVSQSPDLSGALTRLEAAIADAGIAAQVQVGLAIHRRAETTLDELIEEARFGAHPVGV
jgi:PleD family two-component response regulator